MTCTVKNAIKLIVEKLNFLISNLSLIDKNPDNYDLLLPNKEVDCSDNISEYIPLFGESKISEYKSNKYILIKKKISLEQEITNSKIENLINLAKKKNVNFI